MDPGPLDLRDYLSILWARKWTIIAIAATTTAVALAYSFRQTPLYTATAEVVVLPASFAPTDPSAGSLTLNMLTEQQIANSTTVKQEASDRLAQLDIPPGTMSATQVEGAETLVFTSVSSDPKAAQATAEAQADAYLDLRRNALIDGLNAARAPYESQIRAIDAELVQISNTLKTASGETRALLDARYSFLLSERESYVTKLNDLVRPEDVQGGRVLRSADLPVSPSSPLHIRDGLVGLIVGLALGIGVALVRDRLDERIRGREELESYAGAAVLGFIPYARRKDQEPPIALSRPESEAAEGFNALRVRLLHAVNNRPIKSIVVTSSLAGEGKTSVIANLGVVLALAGKRVVMVSADLRRPRLRAYFGGSGLNGQLRPGLTDVLSGRSRPIEALSTTGTKNLSVLDTGSMTNAQSRSELLGSGSMIDLLAKLRDFADIVLIDTPPLLGSSDVVVLAPFTDGALFVVDPRLAHRSHISQSRHELELIGVPVIGVVVNKYEPRRFRTYRSDYSYYGDGHEQGPPDASPKMMVAIPADSEYRTASSADDRDRGGEPTHT